MIHRHSTEYLLGLKFQIKKEIQEGYIQKYGQEKDDMRIQKNPYHAEGAQGNQIIVVDLEALIRGEADKKQMVEDLHSSTNGD